MVYEDIDKKREADRRYYANRSEESKKRKVILQRQRRHAIGLKIVEYLLEHPCEECSEPDPVVLQFDHTRDKVMNISDMVRTGHSLNKIFAEIEKCRVLCANCHMRHTAKQLGWTNYQ